MSVTLMDEAPTRAEAPLTRPDPSTDSGSKAARPPHRPRGQKPQRPRNATGLVRQLNRPLEATQASSCPGLAALELVGARLSKETVGELAVKLGDSRYNWRSRGAAHKIIIIIIIIIKEIESTQPPCACAENITGGF